MNKTSKTTLMTEGSIWKKIIAFAIPLKAFSLSRLKYWAIIKLVLAQQTSAHVMLILYRQDPLRRPQSPHR